MIENNEPEIRARKRRLSLSDVPKILRHGDGSQLSEILHVSNLHIGDFIMRLLDSEEAESSVQILNRALEVRIQKPQ